MPEPIWIHNSTAPLVLLVVLRDRLTYMPVAEICIVAEVFISQRPRPSGQVIIKPNPCILSTALQRTQPGVLDFLQLQGR